VIVISTCAVMTILFWACEVLVIKVHSRIFAGGIYVQMESTRLHYKQA
jgi:hypothetical protein